MWRNSSNYKGVDDSLYLKELDVVTWKCILMI